MKSNPTKRRTLSGWTAAASAAIVLVFTWRGSQQPATDKNPEKPEIRMAGSEPTAKNIPRVRKARSKPDINTAASNRLRDYVEAGELGLIQEDLTALAENRKLSDVSDVLKSWCREGSLELAQWAIVFSEESDTDLSLALCAEALSNPSDVIRDLASAQLEAASEIRFTNPADAKKWLAARPKP
jgi:hypothetical protein